MTGRELILNLVRDGRAPRVPVMPITMMLACDQTHYTYRDYAANCRVLAEAQLAAAARFGFDYVSVISDPCREAADFGAAVRWFDHQPPAVDERAALLADKRLLYSLGLPDPAAGRMGDRVQAVALLRSRTQRGLLVEGWVEGPCAEAADLRGINTLMTDFFDDPAFVADLFGHATENAIRFARAQVQAGADLIGIGDAAASLVGPEIYAQFVWPDEKRLLDAIHGFGCAARLHICGDIAPLLPQIAGLGADILDLDSMVDVAAARAACGPRQVLLGNLDPVRLVKDGTPAQIHAALDACRAAAGDAYIAGAGCEVPRRTPDANVRAFAEWSRRLIPGTGRPPWDS